MKVFWTVVCILGCILFSVMSACFGLVGLLMQGQPGNHLGSLVVCGIALVLVFVAFLLGREAKRRLSQGNR